MDTKEKLYHYLYKTTNLVNQKYYIGIHSTNNIDDGYLGSGKRLWYSINKYGKENFKCEFLYFYNSREELALAEKKFITKEILLDNQNMNIQFGGEGFNTSGMATVRNKDGNVIKVFCDDERYLSGEFVGATKGYVVVKDKNGNIFRVSVNDERYISGELVFMLKDNVTVKDKKGNCFNVSIDDERYISGELVSFNKGRKHSEETKIKIKLSVKSRNLQKGEINSQYGTCWITKEGINKKCKIEDLYQFINEGWIKGRNIAG